MAETIRTEHTLPPDVPSVDPERELPPATETANPRLNEAAEAIGSALGSATRQVQNARDRFTVIRGGGPGPSTTERIREKADDLKQTAQEKVEDMKQRATTAVEQARIEATAKLQDVRVKASRLTHDAVDSATLRARMVRRRVERVTDKRPLAVIAAIGGAAFLLGVILRVMRGKRG